MAATPAVPNSNEPHSLTRGSILARNTMWNMVGLVVPMLVALVAIPPVIRGLGTDRFGVLTVAWVVVGYFSLFDLGLGRALTNIVAYKLGRHETEDLPAVIWTASVVMTLLGVVGGLAFAGASGLLVRSVLKVPTGLQSEVLRSFFVLATSIPFVIISTGFRGVLEAIQKFGLVNVVRVPLGVFTFLAPLVALPFTHDLAWIFAVLVLGRVAACLIYMVMCIKTVPDLGRRLELRKNVLGPLLNFGAWMTVSNTVSPIMAYLDRFLIGAILSMTAVAYYATPYEMVTKILVIPSALVSVMFPAFATALSSDANRGAMLFERTVKYVFVAVFPLTLLVVIFAHPGLQLWLGSDFALHATRPLQILSIGVFLNGLALIPFALVQGAGRADLTGKLHLLELPGYVAAVLFLTRRYGIEGTAVAWTLRVGIDCIGLFWLSNRTLRRTADIPYGVLSAAAAFEILLSLIPNISIFVRVGLFLIPCAAFAIYCRQSLLTEEERNLIKKYTARLRSSGAAA